MNSSVLRTPGAILLICTMLLILIRIGYATLLPLSEDEAYYWQWSLRPALSYPDHPPMVAWLIRAGTTVMGTTAVGVRLFSILLSAIAGFVIFKMAHKLGLSDVHALGSALLFHLLPAPATGAILMTPDVPLALAWCLATYLLICQIDRPTPLRWYLLALVISGACLSKATGFLLYPLTLSVLCLYAPLRSQCRSGHLWMAFMLSLLLLSPWLWSEWHSGFSSFTHQSAHLAGTLPGTETHLLRFPVRLIELVAGQMGLLTPPIFLCLIVAIQRWKTAPPSLWPVLMMTLTPLAATALVAVFTHPEQNWASIGHPLVPLLIFHLRTSTRPVNALRAKPLQTPALFGVVALFTLVIHVHAARPFLPLPPDRDPVSRLHGWEGLRELERHLPQTDSVVSDNYGLAAQFAWLHRDQDLKVTIAATNRPFTAPYGTNWLILDQQNDHGQFSPELTCHQIVRQPNIVLRRFDDERLRIIHVYRGVGCFLKSGPPAPVPLL